VTVANVHRKRTIWKVIFEIREEGRLCLRIKGKSEEEKPYKIPAVRVRMSQ
jgi:hypothetical protein